MDADFENQRRAALVEPLLTNGGIITSIELRALGFGNSAVATMVRRGELERLRRGVYRSTLVPRSPYGATRAAFLGSRSAIAAVHVSSAYLQGLTDAFPDRPQIGAHRGAVDTLRRRKDMDFHGMTDTRTEDLIEVAGIVATTPLRTCLDLARRASTDGRRRVASIVLRAATLNDSDLPAKLLARVKSEPRVPGNQRTRDMIGELPGTLVVRSPLEVEFIQFCVEHGLPLPLTNYVVHGIECDAAWIWAMLAVELDTRTYHDGDEPFERDRARDAVLVVEGWRVLRVTKKRLRKEPEVVAAQIRRLLATGRAA